MKKTPLQKLIDFMEQNQYFIGNDLYAKQKELLEEEKQMVVDAYHTAQIELIEIAAEHIRGVNEPDKEDRYDAEQYFNENYEQ